MYQHARYEECDMTGLGEFGDLRLNKGGRCSSNEWCIRARVACVVCLKAAKRQSFASDAFFDIQR